MDSDAVIGLLMILFWVFSSLVARFARRRRSEMPEEMPDEAAPSPGKTRGDLVQQALRELAEQMGVEVEVSPAEKPVASEHVRTRGEHRQTELETRRTLSEHQVSTGEHQRTASEIRRTASEAARQAAEHDWTAGEHRRGDVQITRLPPSVAEQGARRSEFVRRLHQDLTGGGSSLARAIVLREILGPPVSLRSPEQDRI